MLGMYLTTAVNFLAADTPTISGEMDSYLVTFVLPVILYFISIRVTNMFNSNASYLSLPGSILLVGFLSGILDL